jgi:hypothetical protein
MTIKRRFATIVTDKNGEYSIHSSWKSVCEAYGWDYKKTIPANYQGYTIKKLPFETPIICLELLEYLNRKDIVFDHYKNVDTIKFSIYGYSHGYDVYCEFNSEHVIASTGGIGPYGEQEHLAAYDTDTLTSIRKIHRLDDDYTELQLDDYTEEKVIELLISKLD